MTAKAAPDPLFVLRVHSADVQAVVFDPERRIVYTGDSSGVVIVWDLGSRRPFQRRSLHSQEAGILSLHFLSLTEEQGQLLSQGRDGELKLWLLDEDGTPAPKPVAVMQTLAFSFCQCAVWQAKQQELSNGSMQADLLQSEGMAPAADNVAGSKPEVAEVLVAMSGNNTQDIELWDLEARRVAKTFSQPPDMKCGTIMAVCFMKSLKGQLQILGGYEDGSVALWSCTDANKPLAVVKCHSECIIALDACGSEAFSGSADDQLCKIRAVEAPKLLRLKKQVQLAGGTTSAVSVRHDGRIVAAGGSDGKLRLFGTKSMKPLAVLQYHSAAVAALAFDKETKLLAAGSRDGTVSIWSVYT